MADRDTKLEAIFHSAKKLATSEEREAYLREICKDDPRLRKEVKDLLEASTQAEDIFLPDSRVEDPSRDDA